MISEDAGTGSFAYEKDPAAIYRQSFSIVRAEADLHILPPALQPVAVRLIHACGMTDIPHDLMWSDGVAEIAHAALKKGAPVLCDVEMVVHGIIPRYLPANNQVVCTLNRDTVPALAQ